MAFYNLFFNEKDVLALQQQALKFLALLSKEHSECHVQCQGDCVAWTLYILALKMQIHIAM